MVAALQFDQICHLLQMLNQTCWAGVCDSCRDEFAGVFGNRQGGRVVAKRQCSDCGGELVLAMRSNQPQPAGSEPSPQGSASTNWRCSTCGSVFTAAQLREDKREREKKE